MGAVAVLGLTLTACSSSSPSAGGAGSAPGVTSSEIRVGSLATVTGPLSSGFGEIVDGVRAYFDMVNAEGGVDGRKLVLADVADDTGSPTVDAQAARNLVERDHVFAIVGVGTPFFTASSYLAQQGTPTFGEVVSDTWSKAPNLFGTYGSVLDYSTNGTAVAWMARQVGATTAAVVAYRGVVQSDAACKADAASLQHFGVRVPVADYNYPLGGGNPGADVFRMAGSGVQLLVSCLQGPDNLAFAEAMKQYHLGSASALWLDGYSRAVVSANAAAMQNVYFLFQHVPFEAADQYPSQYPGMVTYIRTMDRYEPKWTYDDTALQGWINAAQFVAGLRAVGSRPLTQQALVDAINRETGFTAGGLMPPLDWRTSHTTAAPPYCSSFAKAYDGRTVPALVRQGGQLFACFNATSDQPVASPPGTPGVRSPASASTGARHATRTGTASAAGASGG